MSLLAVVEIAASSRETRYLLLRIATCLAAASLVFAGAITIDDRVLENGHSVWLKPLRFSIAFGIHLVTLWWLIGLTDRERPGDPWFSFGANLHVGAVIIELLCIGVQASRGEHSHFNYATPFDHTIFTIMGLGTAAVFLGFVFMIAGLVRWPTSRAVNLATIGGLVLAILGGLAGVWMVMPTTEQQAALETGAHLPWIGSQFSGTPSGIEMPLFGWDMQAGDWRIVHFLGLHGLQVLPLLGWLHTKKHPYGTKLSKWLWLGLGSYIALFVAAVGITLGGNSLISGSASAITAWTLFLPIFGTALIRLATGCPRR